MKLFPDRKTTTEGLSDPREFLIAPIGLRALKHGVVVPLILETNPGMEISYSEMQLLWDAIVHKAYHFMCAYEREAKATESTTLDGYTKEEYEHFVSEKPKRSVRVLLKE